MLSSVFNVKLLVSNTIPANIWVAVVGVNFTWYFSIKPVTISQALDAFSLMIWMVFGMVWSDSWWWSRIIIWLK